MEDETFEEFPDQSPGSSFPRKIDDDYWEGSTMARSESEIKRLELNRKEPLTQAFLSRLFGSIAFSRALTEIVDSTTSTGAERGMVIYKGSSKL